VHLGKGQLPRIYTFLRPKIQSLPNFSRLEANESDDTSVISITSPRDIKLDKIETLFASTCTCVERLIRSAAKLDQGPA
jgi:hypothetical protein